MTDNVGQDVGAFLTESLGTSGFYPIRVAARLIDGAVVLLPVQQSGFPESRLVFYYQARGCAGLRLLDHQTGNLDLMPRRSWVRDGKAFYPGNPLQTLTVLSAEVFERGANLDVPGTCVDLPGSGNTMPFGAATFFDITAFVMPLTVQ